MSIVDSVLARVVVDDIDTALPLYEQLAGHPEIRRFSFRDAELVLVGPFLLLSGTPEAMEKYRRTATLMVSDIQAAASAVAEAGGTILEGPGEGPNGPRMIAQHPDGAVFEYIQARTT